MRIMPVVQLVYFQRRMQRVADLFSWSMCLYAKNVKAVLDVIALYFLVCIALPLTLIHPGVEEVVS